MVEDPSQSRKALLKVVKNRVAYSDASRLKSELLALPVQGLLFTTITTLATDPTKIWTDAIRSLPNECYKFVLNAAHDTLPHNSNLHLWKKKPNPSCPLCGHHVLNNCETALHHQRYNQRHDQVLKEIASFITVNLKVSQNMIADLSSQTYALPSHLPCTDLRPDIIWWDKLSKRTVIVELTICFNTLFKQAAERKRKKYFDLCENCSHDVLLITLEVGSRGVIHLQGFLQMQKHLDCSKKDLRTLLVRISNTAIQESFKIWFTRNKEIT